MNARWFTVLLVCLGAIFLLISLFAIIEIAVPDSTKPALAGVRSTHEAVPESINGIITVCPSGPPDCEHDNLQDALIAAGNGDEIKVAAGTYSDMNSIGGHPQIAYISKTVTIRGGYTLDFSDPPDPELNPTILDAGGGGRVLYLTGIISPTIEGVHITGGDATILGSNGGGAYIQNPATATISNTLFYSNTAQNGGGLYADGDLILVNTAFTGNNVPDFGDGGGVRAGGDLILLGGRFEGNHAYEGGGLKTNGDMSMTGTLFISNTAGYFGGGARVVGNAIISGGNFHKNSSDDLGGGLGIDGALTTINTDFISNTTASEGGGVRGFANVTLIEGILRNNHSDSSGGGASVSYNLTISDTQFISNTSQDEGGGAIVSGQVTLHGGIFQNNQSGSVGGGLHIESGGLSMTNTLFISNTASGDGGGARVEGNTIVMGGRFENNHSTEGAGGGLNVNSGSTFLTRTEFINNTAGIAGGGLRAGVGVTLQSALFEGNLSSWDGGGMFILDGDLTISATRFIDNAAQNGGGALVLYPGEGSKRVVNSLFVRNNANTSAGVLSFSSGSFDLLHDTFASTPNYNGEAVYLINYSQAQVKNSIFTGYPTGIKASSSISASEDYNLFYNVAIPTQGTINPGGSSFAGDPSFFNPLDDNYHLSMSSEAIDHGTDVGVMVDFEGDLRPTGAGYDIGYDEFTGPMNPIFLPLVARN